MQKTKMRGNARSMRRIFVSLPDAPEIWAFVLLDDPSVLYINRNGMNDGVIRLVQNPDQRAMIGGCHI